MICTIVKDGERPHLDCIPRDVPLALHSLIELCWQQHAHNRPSFNGESFFVFFCLYAVNAVWQYFVGYMPV